MFSVYYYYPGPHVTLVSRPLQYIWLLRNISLLSSSFSVTSLFSLSNNPIWREHGNDNMVIILSEDSNNFDCFKNTKKLHKTFSKL